MSIRDLLNRTKDRPGAPLGASDAGLIAARVEAVLALHSRRLIGTDVLCDGCGEEAWPCRTARLLDGAPMESLGWAEDRAHRFLSDDSERWAYYGSESTTGKAKMEALAALLREVRSD